MGKYTKAIVAGLLAGLAVLDIATSVGSPGGEGVTLEEWIRVIVCAVAAGLTVWAVPNDPPPRNP